MQNHNIIKLAHFINGKFVGGIERDFTEFINFTYKDVCHFIVTKNKFHHLINKDLTNKVENIFVLNHLGNIKIPKIISKLKFKHIKYKLKSVIQPDVCLLWSIFHGNLVSSNKYYKLIFYDHGEAWYKKAFNSNNLIFLNSVDMIICNSYATKRMLELKWKINNKNLKVVQNALRPSCKPENPNVKTIDKNRPMILGIAGRHVSFKGFPLVACALAELKRRKIPCQLLVAGVGEKLDDLKKLALKLDIEKEVVFLGLVDDMNTFYSKVDLFICPSIREPFGLVNIEAMAHGCPVVVAGVDGMPEILEGTNAGIVIRPTLEIERYPEFGGSLDFLNKIESVYDPYTDSIIKPKILEPAHIANAVEDLWNNPDKFAEMSKNAIKHVNEKFDYEKHVEELYKIIKNV
jgi:glycosyltransferase involved in cell wall biosynthesis